MATTKFPSNETTAIARVFLVQNPTSTPCREKRVSLTHRPHHTLQGSNYNGCNSVHDATPREGLRLMVLSQKSHSSKLHIDPPGNVQEAAHIATIPNLSIQPREVSPICLKSLPPSPSFSLISNPSQSLRPASVQALEYNGNCK